MSSSRAWRHAARPRRLLVATMAVLVLALSPALSAGPAKAATKAPVVVIVFENKSFNMNDPGAAGDTTEYIVGNPDAPYINNTLIPTGKLFTNYHAFIGSLPDYLDITAGTSLCGPQNTGITCTYKQTGADPNDNLFHLLGEAGIGFQSYMQSMPSACYPSTDGPYVPGHNPEALFTDLTASTRLSYDCPQTDTPAPATWPSTLAPFTLVSPDECHDMHGLTTGSCQADSDAVITAGDTWLADNVPALLQRGAIVIVTWDEAGDGDTSTEHIPTIMLGPGITAGSTDATRYTQYGLLAGLESYYGVTPLLANAASAVPVPFPTNTNAPNLPGAPSRVVASSGAGSVTVRWGPPANNGGAAIQHYDVTLRPTGTQRAVTGTTTTFTGLTPGATYTASVSAHTSAGSGPAATSAAVTPTKLAPVLHLDALPSSKAAWGTPLTVTTTVTSGGRAATGDVAIRVDGTVRCASAPLAAGHATCKSSEILAVGQHRIAATYTGDASTASKSVTQEYQVTRAATALRLHVSPRIDHARGPVILAGRLTVAGTAAPLAARRIAVFARRLGASTWHRVRSVMTDGHGRVSLVVQPRHGTEYQLRRRPAKNLLGAHSRGQSVRIR